MNKSNIFIFSLLFALLATAIGISTAFAKGENNAKGFGKFFRGENLTAEQKLEMQTKIEAIKLAIEAGDYDAWVKAEKAVNANSPMLNKVTKDSFTDYAAKFKAREEKMAEQKTKNDAVRDALGAGNYNAWAAAEKAINENCPKLKKINANNFSQYLEAWKLRQQADNIMKDLGLEGPADGREGDFAHGMMPGGFSRGGQGGHWK